MISSITHHSIAHQQARNCRYRSISIQTGSCTRHNRHRCLLRSLMCNTCVLSRSTRRPDSTGSLLDRMYLRSIFRRWGSNTRCLALQLAKLFTAVEAGRRTGAISISAFAGRLTLQKMPTAIMREFRQIRAELHLRVVGLKCATEVIEREKRRTRQQCEGCERE